MGYQWEPQWEEVVIEYAGGKVKTRRDKVTGLIMCPLCNPDKPTYFFSERDLFLHIKAHRDKPWVKHKVVTEKEEEEEREEES